MNGNIWEAICEHLDVEPDEPFKLSFVSEKDCFGERYKIKTYGKDAGLYVDLFGNNNWVKSTLYLNKLLGFGTIAIQEPWKPKVNEEYWHIYWYVEENGDIAHIEVGQSTFTTWYTPDLLRVGVSNCFKTEKQAENNKFKVFERLVGKTWAEWCEENGYLNAEASQTD
jgi:hypothetical protein